MSLFFKKSGFLTLSEIALTAFLEHGRLGHNHSMQDWTPLQQLKGHKRSVICLDYSSKSFIGGHLLASGSGW
jgi:hypothetical protein